MNFLEDQKLHKSQFLLDLNKEGKQIGSYFTLGKIIGQGSFGEVYEAIDISGNVWAIKWIWRKTNFLKDWFEEEAKNMMQLDHINIVKLEGIYMDNIYYYIIMELVKGEMFSNYIKNGIS